MRTLLWPALILFVATPAAAAPSLPRTLTADHTLTMTGRRNVTTAPTATVALPRTMTADHTLAMTGQRNVTTAPATTVALPRTLTADHTLTMTGQSSSSGIVHPKLVPIMKQPVFKPIAPVKVKPTLPLKPPPL